MMSTTGEPPPGGTQQTSTNTVLPHYLIISRTDDGTFEKSNPWKIEENLTNLVGPVKNCVKSRGNLQVEVKNSAQASKLLQLKNFMSLPINVSPHKTMNSAQGVVQHPDLLYCSEQEIVEGLQQQGVTHARKMKRNFPDGQKKDTSTVVLTFNTPIVPQKIRVGYTYIEVRPYIPAPRRCYHCLGFTHTKKWCKALDKPQVCNCGQDIHEGVPCEASVCRNCKGNHPTLSKICPVYVRETKIETLHALEQIPYPEARRKVAAQSVSATKSYSQATQNQTTPMQSTVDVHSLAEAIKPIIKNIMRELLSEFFQLKPDFNLSRAKGLSMSSLHQSMESISSVSKRKAAEQPEVDATSDELTEDRHDPQKSSKKKKKKSGKTNSALNLTPNSQADNAHFSQQLPFSPETMETALNESQEILDKYLSGTGQNSLYTVTDLTQRTRRSENKK